MDLWEISDLATPWCVHVAATLRIADYIADGHTEIGDLARAAGADRDFLERILRQLVSKGMFTEPTPGQFGLNELAEQLRGGGRIGFDLEGFGGRMAYAWGSLLSAVRTGKPAYREVHGWDFWEDLDAHPKLAAEFDRLMGPEGHGIPDPEVLLNSADWESIRTVVDVGGGTGTLLAEILRANPSVRGILVDVPRAVANSAPTFEAAGVADRVTVSAQSFFDPLPSGADLYLLKNVLADWPDAESMSLLRRCAEAARPNGRVMILSGIGPGPVASPELLMLVLVGGKDRTLAEFEPMAAAAGLKVREVGRLKSGKFAVECVPV